jgi:hypothetical protein
MISSTSTIYFAARVTAADIPFALIVALLIAAAAIAQHVVGRLIFREKRQLAWSNVMFNSKQWAESVGGTLKRVSEQQPVKSSTSPAGRPGEEVVALRYRVTFTNADGDECVAMLRYALADANWSLEGIVRDEPVAASDSRAGDEPEHASTPQPTEDGYFRRHRAHTGNVPVIFAKPKRPRPPRRSR